MPVMATEHEDITLAPDETFRLLRWTRSVSRVEVVRGGRGTPIPGQGDHWHYHRAMELTFIEHGAGTRFVADHIEMFHDGDLILIGSNVPHYWHSRGRYSGLSVQWDFPLDHGIWSFGQTVAPLQTLAKSALHGLHLKGDTAHRTADAMAALAALDELPRLVAFLHLLSTLASAPACDVEQLSGRPFALDGTAEQQEAMARAVSYVLAHYREPIRLEDLLRLTHMSRATFARQFHRHAGKSFSDFLNQVRLQAVCRALMESAESISAIAFNHGFNQLSFFNRLFRREFGISPRDYRRDQSHPNGESQFIAIPKKREMRGRGLGRSSA
jgi:AraC-like DNA-binding protein/mannose-6-phosphate isomerase-like protein (cupin superfamily)